LSLLNQIFKPLQLETAHTDFAFAVNHLLRQRLADGGGVFSNKKALGTDQKAVENRSFNPFNRSAEPA